MRAPTVLTALVAVTLSAADPPAQLLRETREVVLLDGSRIGTWHTTVKEDGTGRLRVATELDLNVRVYGSAVHLRREYADEETSDGRVLNLTVKQLQGHGRQLSLAGTAEGDRMHVVVDGGRIERRLRWGDEVLGLAAQERLLVDRRPKAGDRFTFQRYEPTFNTVVTVQVAVKQPEAIGEKGQKLLRIEFQPDKLEAPGQSIVPPGSVVWVDASWRPLRREMELDGVGKVVILPTGGDASPGPVEEAIDIGLRNLVPLNRRIAMAHAVRNAVFRITLQSDSPAAFARDGHQEIRNVQGSSFDLVIHPVRPVPGTSAGPAADEYATSNYFVDSDDPSVRDMARRAASGATDAWSKAVRIERWVNQAMQPSAGSVLVPASRTARELRGDCRAYALLTAALCRAEGIPSRTALGLLYVERSTKGPCLGFHMWTEVCIGGRWIGLDGTLGQGGVDACHVKISDHSWAATRSLTPLLPADRVLGKMRAEVVSVDGGP
jgi:transglutaminase-like putative cysteine protease